MSNLPCPRCFHAEARRCFNDRLAHVHGLLSAPRDKPLFSGLNGLEVTDALLTACVESGAFADRTTIMTKALRAFERAGAGIGRVKSAGALQRASS